MIHTLKDGTQVEPLTDGDPRILTERTWSTNSPKDPPSEGTDYEWFYVHKKADSPWTHWVKVRDDAVVPPTPRPILTQDKAARKEMPIARGFLKYFPRAAAAVAHVSYKANEQHNPGQPMHWARGKSTDHADCIVRHLIEAGTVDDDGLRHTAKLAWRAMALLETELELADGIDAEAEARADR